MVSLLEGRDLGSIAGYFDGTRDEVCGPCVGLGVGGIMTDFEIYAIQLNDSSPVSCKVEMWSLMLLAETFYVVIYSCVMVGYVDKS